MTCEEFLRLLDQTDALTDGEKEAMRAHREACAACAHAALVREDLSRLDEIVEVPDGFAPAWRRLIREGAPMEQKTKARRPLRAWLVAAAALVFVLGGTLSTRGLWTGVQSSQPYNEANSYGTASAVSGMRAAAVPEAANGYVLEDAASDTLYTAKMAAGAAESAEKTAKIIREASFTIRTQAFEDDYEKLKALVTEFGGTVEYASVSGDVSAGTLRTARLTLRIPTDQLDGFLTGASGVGEITGKTESSEDVSENYYDLQSRLETQQAKMARLRELMGKTDSVTELIEVESAIADTQYMIDSYQSSLNGYDSRIAMSAVTVTLRETTVRETKTSTLGDRIQEAFSDSVQAFAEFMQDMLLFLLAALPWLIALAAVVFIIVFIAKKRKHKGGN